MFNYFKNKNYLAFYLNNIGTKFASTLVLSFTGAYFYDYGMSLFLILLYFALEFGFRALFSPLGGFLSSRIGFRKTINLSYIILIFYFISLGFIKQYFWLGYFGFLLHSLSRGIYYPIKHLTQSLFIENGDRGKFLTFEMVLTTLIGILAISFASYSVIMFKSFFPVVILASIFLLISILSIHFLLDENEKKIDKINIKEIYSFFLGKKFRNDLIGFTGFSTNIIINNVIIGLITFYFSNDFKTFSIIMNLVLAFELIFTLLFGYYIDKNKNKATSQSSILQTISYFSYIFIIKTPIALFILQSFYKIIWNMFDSSFTARFHTKINGSRNSTIYACAKEMSLGFSMFVVLSILSLCSIFFNEKVFIMSFWFGILGILILNKKFVD